MSFALTPRQQEANDLLGGMPTHTLLEGGSRSGKTLLFVRAIVLRALKARYTRHTILRFRFNACKEAIGMDTLPKVMRDCFPEVGHKLDKGDWFMTLPSKSEVWLGGLDDKDRTEKILGKEYATILLNECSQIPFSGREMARTRLAQSGMQDTVAGMPPEPLPLRMYYDWNPTSTRHWVNRLFKKKVDPITGKPLLDASLYQWLKMNPKDNECNLPASYLQELQSLSPRLRRRFWEGEASDESDNMLFKDADIDKWRVLDGKLPDFQRIVVSVDPSGSDDENNDTNDAIGINVSALGVDGVGYCLEDLTVKAGPAIWGKVACNAFDRHGADRMVGEANYGGAMVKHVIDTIRPRTPFSVVHATRGKVQRAEPFSSLVEQGKIRLVGYLPELEDELSGFTTNGYIGEGSPNRADAFIWAMAELFPGIISGAKKQAPTIAPAPWYIGEGSGGGSPAGQGWMGS